MNYERNEEHPLKKIMMLGTVGCGKTTLSQRLLNEEIRYKKTQQVLYDSFIIDTPGEFVQHRNLYSALMTTSVDAKLILLLASATNSQNFFSPSFAQSFNKPTIGVITKIDLANEKGIAHAKKELKLAGATKIFKISSTENIGIEELTCYIEQMHN